jgi:hypothetical protein
VFGGVRECLGTMSHASSPSRRLPAERGRRGQCRHSTTSTPARYPPLTSASPRDGTKAPNHRASRTRDANRRRANHFRANRPRANRPPPRSGAAATVSGWAGAGAAAAIGAAPIATAAAPAANIGVMYFNPIRIIEPAFDGLSALPFSRFALHRTDYVTADTQLVSPASRWAIRKPSATATLKVIAPEQLWCLLLSAVSTH